MNDLDYIRKGIELADDWEITLDDEQTKGPWVIIKTKAMYLEYHSRWPWVRDLLAAQLIRQVDALGFLDFDVDGGGVTISCPSNPEFTPIRLWGDDRTMNTIKCIVDSEVLK